MKNLRKIGITSCNQCSAELPDSGFRAAGVFLHPRADAAGIPQTVVYVDYYCAKCSFAGRYEMHLQNPSKTPQDALKVIAELISRDDASDASGDKQKIREQLTKINGLEDLLRLNKNPPKV